MTRDIVQGIREFSAQVQREKAEEKLKNPARQIALNPQKKALEIIAKTSRDHVKQLEKRLVEIRKQRDEFEVAFELAEDPQAKAALKGALLRLVQMQHYLFLTITKLSVASLKV